MTEHLTAGVSQLFSSVKSIYSDFVVVCPHSDIPINLKKQQQHDLSRLTFLNNHSILSTSLKEPFSGNSVKICDCRAFVLTHVAEHMPSTAR